MPLTPSLLNKLRATYPHLQFLPGERFSWSPDKKTVFYDESDPGADALMLHELSHGLLDHRAYSKDVQLIAMEAAAWENARSLAAEYTLEIPEELAESHLDTYRDWLHARSTCPACRATGFQDGANTYACPACHHRWKVNEARLCELRRVSL